MHILNSVLLLPLTIRMVLGAAIGLDKRDNGGDLGSKLNRKFDFFNPNSGVSEGKDGRIVSGNADTFPAVIGNGVALSIGILGPCGLNTPHVHPRATEYNLAINGTLDTVFFQQNDAETVLLTLAPGQATVFPAGGVHAEMNTGCETAMFVAAFSNEDPGTLSVAQGLFQAGRADFTAASLGDIGVEEVKDIAGGIPEAIAFGIDECLQRCGLTRPSSFDASS